jgi:hypothetical protein
MFENANVIATSPTAISNINIVSGGIYYWTANATTNFTANIRGDANIPLNSILGINQSSTIALGVPQSSIAFYPNVIRIDNTTITPVWLSGFSITSGNPNSIDFYTFTILKTADATFRVFAGQARYQHTG